WPRSPPGPAAATARTNVNASPPALACPALWPLVTETRVRSMAAPSRRMNRVDSRQSCPDSGPTRAAESRPDLDGPRYPSEATGSTLEFDGARKSRLAQLVARSSPVAGSPSNIAQWPLRKVVNSGLARPACPIRLMAAVESTRRCGSRRRTRAEARRIEKAAFVQRGEPPRPSVPDPIAHHRLAFPVPSANRALELLFPGKLQPDRSSVTLLVSAQTEC